MAVDIARLRAKWEALKADKARVEGIWDEIERFIMPAMGRSDDSSGESRDKLETAIQAWDSTAILACEHLAASLHGSVTNPAARWLDYEWSVAALEKEHEAVKHREELAELVWSELQASDFNMEIASGYHEYAGVGNMLLTVEPTNPERWEGLDFTAVSVREGDFEEDSRGGLRSFWRLLRWTPGQIIDRFNQDGKTPELVPERIRKLAELPDAPANRIDVVFTIFRRDDIPLVDGLETLVPEKRPFGSVYFTLEQGEQLGEEGGYYEMPAVVARWGKVPGSKWGFGRGNVAIRNVKYLNSFKESARCAAEKANDPSWKTTERGLLSDLNNEPGGVTVVASMDDLQPNESASRFDVSAEVLRDERSEVRRVFHEDDLMLKESPQMTATEVQARRDMMDRVLGSPVGRLQTDALVPLCSIVLRHLYRAGRLPKAPAVVNERQATLKVRFRGPIARAQLLDEVVAIERVAGFVASLMKQGLEEARHYIDLSQTLREHAKRVGAPTSMLKSPQDVKKAIEAEAQLARAAAEAEIGKNQGQGALAQAQAAALPSAPPAAGGTLQIGTQPALVPSGAMLP